VFRAEEKAQPETHLLVVGSNRFGQAVTQDIFESSILWLVGQVAAQVAVDDELP
jgi:hypothetical protein